MTIAPATPAAALVAPHSDKAADLNRAAHQFEAMFVGQMLRSVRESSEDEDAGANGTYLEMAEEQFSQALSAKGGLGIATMVVSKLGDGA